METKRCPGCGETKLLDAFSRHGERLQSRCRACFAAYYMAHRASILAGKAAARKAEPERFRAYDATEAHRAYNRAYQALRRAADPEAAKAANRRSYAANIEAGRARNARRTPEVIREHIHRRRARMRAAFVEPVSFAVLYKRDNGRCGICGKAVPRVSASIDHILPLSRGGSHSYANTRIAHRACNSTRGNRGVAQLRMLG